MAATWEASEPPCHMYCACCYLTGRALWGPSPRRWAWSDADILAMDIVERSPEQAVDDIVVALPAGRQPDVLITAAETVPGVRVESVRPDPGVAARHREWELVEAIAADPKDAVTILARMLPQVLRAGWAIVVRTCRAQR